MSEAKSETWEELSSAAKQTVDALIFRLPEELRPEALRIGYELRKRSRDEDGEGTLGRYARSAHLITLYVETIHDHCLEEARDFSRELEIVYLHELGHHLGLDEDDLEKRGL